MAVPGCSESAVYAVPARHLADICLTYPVCKGRLCTPHLQVARQISTDGRGPGCRESAAYAALHPVIASPSYPAPTPAARRYQHAAPLEVDCALRPAAGRSSARPSRRLGRSAGHAHLAWSVALKWCHSTGRWLLNRGSGRPKLNISNSTFYQNALLPSSRTLLKSCPIELFIYIFGRQTHCRLQFAVICEILATEEVFQ